MKRAALPAATCATATCAVRWTGPRLPNRQLTAALQIKITRIPNCHQVCAGFGTSHRPVTGTHHAASPPRGEGAATVATKNGNQPTGDEKGASRDECR